MVMVGEEMILDPMVRRKYDVHAGIRHVSVSVVMRKDLFELASLHPSSFENDDEEMSW